MPDRVIVSDLVKTYGGLRAVDGLSFTVEAGCVLGFLGPNGAGKSTTMKIITGFLPASAGSVSVCGHPVDREPLAAKRCLGYLPEGAPAYGEMTPWQFLGFVADIRGLPRRQARLDQMIGRLELEPVLHRPIGTLSKGYRRRVGLAQAILHDPRVLVMDEPTDGLDPNQKRQVRDFINEMARDKIILVSTHILEEVDAMCTRAIIIAGGRLLADDTPEGLRARSRYHRAATVGPGLDDDARAELSALDEVALAEPAADGGLTLLPKPGREPAAAARAALDRRGLGAVPLHVQGGRLDDVFHTLTRNVRE